MYENYKLHRVQVRSFPRAFALALYFIRMIHGTSQHDIGNYAGSYMNVVTETLNPLP